MIVHVYTNLASHPGQLSLANLPWTGAVREQIVTVLTPKPEVCIPGTALKVQDIAFQPQHAQAFVCLSVRASVAKIPNCPTHTLSFPPH